MNNQCDDDDKGKDDSEGELNQLDEQKGYVSKLMRFPFKQLATYLYI